jgi:hypothetical protein
MLKLRGATWAPPVVLGALAVVLLAAVIVAREKRQLPAQSPIQQIRKPSEIRMLDAGASYGPGLTHVVRSPLASLRPILGDQWRELSGAVGRVLIRPDGTPSRYFEVSAVTVARKPARLEILTSEGQRAIEVVRTGRYSVTNFGPLIAPRRGRIGLALSSVQPRSSSIGPSLILSPLQAEYLSAGEWVTGMPALAQIGPGGLRGVYLAIGSTTQFAMSPGIRGRCDVALQGTGVGGALRVTVTVGREVRSTLVSGRLGVVTLGPFSRASTVLSMTVESRAGELKRTLFLSDLRFVAAAPRP